MNLGEGVWKTTERKTLSYRIKETPINGLCRTGKVA
jgi:hypothetical protein